MNDELLKKKFFSIILFFIYISLDTAFADPLTFISKDSYTDFRSWNESIAGISLESAIPEDDGTRRVFLRSKANATGIIESVTLAVWFNDSTSNTPNNSPSFDALSLSILLFNNFFDVLDFPESVGFDLDPNVHLNSDWNDAPITNIEGTNVYKQTWNVVHLELPAFYSSDFFLSIYNEESNVNPTEIPTLIYAPRDEYAQGTETDRWFNDLLFNRPETLLTRENNTELARQVASKIVIRENENFIRSFDIETIRGNHISGDLSDLYYSNNSYMSFTSGFTLNSDESPLWLETNISMPLPEGEIDSVVIHFEVGASTPNLFRSIYIYDFTEEVWTPYDFRDQSMSDHRISFIFDEPHFVERFLDPKKRVMRFMISWDPDGFLLHSPWVVRIDEFRVIINEF